MLADHLARLKVRVRQAVTDHPALVPLFVRVRGLARRTLRVKDREFSFLCGPHEYCSTHGVDREGKYEGPFVERLVDSLVATRNPVLFDVGGNVGFDSLVAAGFGVRDIHVFEPDPVATFYIRRNLRGVNHVLVEMYVGDRETVGRTTLDGYCGRTGVVPTHIKMDIEGHEMECLPGMEETLSRHRPTIFLEFHERIIREELRYTESAVADFFRRLAGLGYRLEYNGHQYEMITSPDRRYRYEWSAEPPNHVNFAVVATPT